MYKAKNNLAPTEVAELLNLNNSRYSLRNKDFHLPIRFNTVTYGKHSFRYFGPLLWKRLNNKVKQSPSLQSFKNAIRNLDISAFILLFYLINFAPQKTNKQTNKQKERWQGHRNSCGQLQWARKLTKKIKTRNIKKHSDTRKTTATYIYVIHWLGGPYWEKLCPRS